MTLPPTRCVAPPLSVFIHNGVLSPRPIQKESTSVILQQHVFKEIAAIAQQRRYPTACTPPLVNRIEHVLNTFRFVNFPHDEIPRNSATSRTLFPKQYTIKGYRYYYYIYMPLSGARTTTTTIFENSRK